MEGLLTHFTRIAILTSSGVATAFLFIGTVQVFINGIRVMLVRSTPNHKKRKVWIQFSQWLIAGLTVQLAADILETSIAPSWQDIGKLAAIAGIRTFLNYFLDNDMREIRKRDSPEPETIDAI